MNYNNNFQNFDLISGTSISDAFLSYGIKDFYSATKYIRELPYGRNSNKTNRLLVLTEQRGTCSGKHALLAELAQEQNKPFELYFGFFKISENTHPAVAPILEKYGLTYYPELHAFLVSNGVKYDFTGMESPIEPLIEFMKELPVRPDQVENYKEEAHKNFLASWLITEGLSNKFNLDQLWKIREECIKARSLV